MKTSDAVGYYGTTTALAESLDITPSAISQWNGTVPEWAAARLEKLTDGKLKYDHEFYMRLKAKRKQAA